MLSVEKANEIFSRYGGMMRTKQLSEERIYYKDIERLIKEGYVEKIRTGYYQLSLLL